MGTYFLVRHGETKANQEGVLQGHLDVPLNDTGRRQAARVARALAGYRLDAVFSSDLSRAAETARCIAAMQGCPLILDDRLRELHCGEMQGLTISQCRERFPGFFDALEKDPVGTRRPGGESYRDLHARATSALEDIRRRYPSGKVAVVTHGLVIKCLLAYASGEEVKLHTPVVSNASISVISWDEHDKWKVLLRNEVRHLQEPDGLDGSNRVLAVP